MLIGNVGKSPDVRMTPSGSKVCKFSLATNRRYKDHAGAEQEKTEWHRCTAFGRLADIVERWVNQGDRLYVEGRIEYSTTDDGEGNTRYWTDIIVNEMVMLGSNAAPAAAPAPAPVSEPSSDLPF